MSFSVLGEAAKKLSLLFDAKTQITVQTVLKALAEIAKAQRMYIILEQKFIRLLMALYNVVAFCFKPDLYRRI